MNHQLPLSHDDPDCQTNISLIIHLDPNIRLLYHLLSAPLKFFLVLNKTVNFLKTRTSVSLSQLFDTQSAHSILTG